MKSPITTHVLDTSLGRPATGMEAVLQVQELSGTWREVGRGVTDADGRIHHLVPLQTPLEKGHYRLTFETGAYFRTQARPTFYPQVTILFAIQAPDEHYHVPLLLNPFGYSTYRGS